MSILTRAGYLVPHVVFALVLWSGSAYDMLYIVNNKFGGKFKFLTAINLVRLLAIIMLPRVKIVHLGRVRSDKRYPKAAIVFTYLPYDNLLVMIVYMNVLVTGYIGSAMTYERFVPCGDPLL